LTRIAAEYQDPRLSNAIVYGLEIALIVMVKASLIVRIVDLKPMSYGQRAIPDA
jgi:hypothetical protein